MAEPAATPAQNPKLYRTAFYALWFVVVPALLAVVTIWLLKPADPDPMAQGLGRLRFWVYDQPVPVGIVLFTAFEMLLYHYRYNLPLAGRVGIGGRPDLPPEVRRQFEQAAHLLDEASRIRKKNEKSIARNVPSKARGALDESLDNLRDSMQSEPFDEREFHDALEDAAELVDRHLGRWRKGELREYVESIGIAVRRRTALARFRGGGVQDPQRVHAAHAADPGSHLREQVRVRPAHPVHHQARVAEPAAQARGRDRLRIPGSEPGQRAPGLHQAGDRFARRHAHGGRRPPVHQRLAACPTATSGSYEFFEGDEQMLKRGELFVEYLGDYSYLTLFEDDRFDGRQGPYFVKPGEVWVLGDNRNNSSDSRAWFGGRGGGAPFANIKGRAMFVWMSFGVNGGITWDRIFTDVMGHPRLPKIAPQELKDGIAKCLAKRPPVSETTPPAPK